LGPARAGAEAGYIASRVFAIEFQQVERGQN
jgi:hypothetical protein